MKIMKLHLDLEMRLINVLKIKFFKYIFSFLLLISFVINLSSCKKNTTKSKIIGIWEINKIIWQNGTSSQVPNDEKYKLILNFKGKQAKFKVDDVSGDWFLDDSLLIFKNIPESKTYVDSIFVENDALGNSSIVLKNGNQLIATITNNGIEPELVTQVLKLIYVDNKELHLSNNGDVYIYIKSKK